MFDTKKQIQHGRLTVYLFCFIWEMGGGEGGGKNLEAMRMIIFCFLGDTQL
jgi:hypothetical protein